VTSFQTGRIDAATVGTPTQFIMLPRLHNAQVDTNGPLSIYVLLCSVVLMQLLYTVLPLDYMISMFEPDVGVGDGHAGDGVLQEQAGQGVDHTVPWALP
jgi:hypothetical protein